VKPNCDVLGFDEIIKYPPEYAVILRTNHESFLKFGENHQKEIINSIHCSRINPLDPEIASFPLAIINAKHGAVTPEIKSIIEKSVLFIEIRDSILWEKVGMETDIIVFIPKRSENLPRKL
jgi:hypothetical protein